MMPFGRIGPAADGRTRFKEKQGEKNNGNIKTIIGESSDPWVLCDDLLIRCTNSFAFSSILLS